MSVEVKVPNLPESVSDATVAKWHKKPGDGVERDEVIVDLETDKVVLEVPAPADGVLSDISAEEGETVTEGQVLGQMDEGEAPSKSDKEESDESSEEDGGEKTSEDKDDKGDKDSGDGDKSRDKDGKDEKKSGPSKASDKDLPPSARRMVAENDLDPSQIEGSGRGGRVTKGDVMSHMAGGATGPRPEERVKMSRLRSRIAERMKEAQNTAAILTSFNEVDLKAVMDIRSRYKEDFQNKHGVKLGFMSFFVKAACEALQKHPVVNASVDGDEIVYHGYQDIGIAVSTDRGLLVPVIRDAHRMGLAEIEQSIADYAEKARKGTIQLEDLQGGTFTITNGGVFGSLLSTPLLNMPQSAILGMHTIKERPVAINGEIVIRPMMYIALSYDHRIIDGKDAVQFLVALKEGLEDPARMLLGL
ncbi:MULTISPECIES: 2-oxoglutarate dehydrogenase complex dihydrolipoyllysine-residue succinyltransferase [unclassified Wenzhouxiangella]|uniref:2-oxoglutarate dehydrogenase complex dihydrolipoyllysine-residue succinyltransferase n=1 Tax=unclassified Wenzhouxiangella TaxID=2613841 RepID=UPI000E32A555|nr:MULTISPECIES: 2-oxoglutarate dehydrogenase complex dihydrolipoyllysine-residue succinyltransferase [unclassified Wenzhouxiangella]RFF28648.1 2-oxoglutarate dehydrogenase complex dihydrolipoyllysine-residue succinyltransferase [Wenzhouxiangella sp. 15181]RFP68962.1 2-oxoglutarate dehydrogenase complex dihydrolipoyllysine-residue succinyltransferase [Wenzhouxiangella sp. 15190]